jgi:hypothetical protein
MQLWTHHTPDFQIDDPGLTIDPQKGPYWQINMEGFCYRTVLPQFQMLLGTSQFLWCCTTRGQFVSTTEDLPLVEWELDVPGSQILRFIRTRVWEDLVWGRSNTWDGLFITDHVEPGAEVVALAPAPLATEWVRRRGLLLPQFSKASLEMARSAIEERKNIDPVLLAEYEMDEP